MGFETVRGGKTQIVFTRPKVMDIRGITAVGDGARITVRLHDADWTERRINTFTFEVDPSQTIMQDHLSVRGAQWGRKVDMSKDPKMYSFSRDAYFLVMEFNPRGTSPFLQDKLGWSGEGMTDLPDPPAKTRSYIWVHKRHPENQKDIRIIRKVYRLTRDQIMGVRPVTEKDVISNEEFERIQEENAKKDAAAQEAAAAAATK
jgi:hypothetical protein